MNKWISVDMEMPKPEEQVLAHFNDGFIATVSTDKNGEWELWADCGEVTHWMHLPSPPRKDSYENNLETICADSLSKFSCYLCSGAFCAKESY